MSKSRSKSVKSLFGGGFAQSSFERPAAQTKPPKAILIVTEGRNTEPLYFRSLSAHWSLHPHVTRIAPGGEGIPANLVKKALAVQKERAFEEKAGRLPFNQLGKFDETWIVFDTEHAQRHARLVDGIELAERHGIRVAHSTPCFEFWLALHYASRARPMNTCKEACRLFETVAGLKRGAYAKEEGVNATLINKLICHVSNAVQNAEQLTKRREGEAFPVNPSASVQALIRSMHNALPEEMKKRFPLPESPRPTRGKRKDSR